MRSDDNSVRVGGNGSMDKARAESIALEQERETGMLVGFRGNGGQGTLVSVVRMQLVGPR